MNVLLLINYLMYVLYLHRGWGQVQLTKYSSTPSTRNITKYKYWSVLIFFKKYLSTSSTFISSTSIHIKIFHWSLIRKGTFPDYFFVLNKLINCIISYYMMSHQSYPPQITERLQCFVHR